MSDSKYYTPELMEFSHRFEFEIHNSKGKYFIPGMKEGWHSTYMDFGILGDIQNIQKLIIDKQVRVPFLSKEDIEAEGFTYNKHQFSEDFWKGDVNDNVLIEVIHDNTLCIKRRVNGMLESEIIGIKIKNKSELRRILKMI